MKLRQHIGGQMCWSKKEFDLDKEEVLTSLKKVVDGKILKDVNKNNKISSWIVQETHVDRDCIIVRLMNFGKQCNS